MSIEHAFAPAPPVEPASIAELTVPSEPVDELLMEAAAELAPGKALELGCGTGQDALWLAQEGWSVTGVDPSTDAVEIARQAAQLAGVTVALVVADLASWRPESRFDLVVATYSLPARGMGRSRMLESAVDAVAPGGTIVISELDVALHHAGRMAERYLVSLDELERYLDGFRIRSASTSMVMRPHGYEGLAMPVAHVVATRRTDLRTL
jgi:SAM-dependent methyltransferase